MSSNQKPAPAVVPQTRYPPGTFIQRTQTSQRPDTFHVPTQQPYVPQLQPNQTGNQGPTIRGMTSAGPPNQASTPPNSELKQQQPMNIAYASQRGGGQNYYRPPPQNQTQRMANHRQGQQSMFQTPAQFVPLPAALPPMYCPMPFYPNSAQRPPVVSQYFPTNQSFTLQYQQPPAPAPTYVYNPQYMTRAGPQSQVQPAPPNLPQVTPANIGLTQNTQQLPTRNKRRREKAIPIIDPISGVDKLCELYEQDESHPPSGESSARQTPQPHHINKEVQHTFNKQVHMVINQEKMEEIENPIPVVDQQVDTQAIYQPPPPQAVLNTSRLQVQTKEFVPAIQSITAKETTPVVSANTDAAEVTLNKPKDRESPVKNRKQREHNTTREIIKETQAIIEKSNKEELFKNNKEEYKLNKDEYKKETLSPVPSIACSKEIKEIINQREEKIIQKIAAEEQKIPTNTNSSQEIVADIAPVPPIPLPVPAQDNVSAKKRNKEVPKQVQQQPAPTSQKAAAPVSIPHSQPSKSNSKTSKLRELNMKGANKEGTDMDAFSDNIVSAETNNPNINITNSNTVNDNYNINDLSINTNDSNKKNESNDLPTIKSDIKTLPKNKVDVTAIVKDVPKPFVPPVESQDEPDRIELTNEKLVQAKNEANVKANTDDSNIETKPSLPYKQDQWSPSNPDGKKIYEKDFLLALRNDPKSRKKPDNLLDVVAQEDRGRIGDINRYPMGGRTTDFAPNFGSNYSSKSSSQRGSLAPKRGSQQGKIGGGSKGKTNTVIRVSISVREDVKLHETENAWKPARFTGGANMSDEEKKTMELYRKVRGVLNKLTPQKFTTLVSQVRELAVDTPERLQGVIDLVFEKAVDEPNFSVAYALMCRELALMQVPTYYEGKVKEGEFVNFRKLMVTRCQLEFEKNSADETSRNEKLKEVEECTDPEKKKELQLLLEEEDRRIRRKSVGNIRFIGELFKQQMLTVNIMNRCLKNLLDNKDEESLECLCKLLTTVGMEIEVKKQVNLANIFQVMKEIVDKKHGKISSRVRFMIQDVIDLRNAKWVPRRQDLNPTTMEQIQKEADTEQLNIQAMNSTSMNPRKDERGSGSNADRKRNRNNASDNEGWSTPSSRNRAFSVQSDKLKNKPPQIDEPLGSSQMFGNWTRGSNIKTTNFPPPATNTGNMYAALENIGNEIDKRTALGSRSTSKDPYNSKGPSLERNYKHSFEDGRGSRSGSQHRSNDSSQRSTPVPMPPQTMPKSNTPVPLKTTNTTEQITPEHWQLRIKNIIDESINDCCSVAASDEDIRTSIPASELAQFVTDSYMYVVERSKTSRLRTGFLFAQLIKLGTLSLDNYCIGLEEVLNQADDLTIDIPKIWDYLAEMIAPVICEENCLPLTRLQQSCKTLISQSHCPKLLGPLLKLVVEEKGPNYLSSIWQESGLTLLNFMDKTEINSFVESNKFEFLLGGSNSVVGQSGLTYDQIYDKLMQFFAKKSSFDDIINWIMANVGDRVNEKQFIRTLATAIFEDSIVKSKLKTDILRNHYTLITRFVDSNPDYELQCLYALQALINKLEHPPGILLQICNSMFDESLFSHDSFIAWENSKDPAEQEGKGVALKQLVSFFTQLKEADEDTSSASEDA